MGSAERIMQMPVGFEERAFLLQAAVLPKAMYASAVNFIMPSQLSSFRSLISRSLWGCGRRFRSNEIIFSMLSRGHCLDPFQVVAYSALSTLHNMVCFRPALHNVLKSTWEITRSRRGRHGGPITRIRKTLRCLSWDWPDLHTLVTDTGIILHLPSLDRREFQHEVRESLRRWQLKEAASKRKDMEGAQRGVDRRATLSLMSHKKTSAYSKGVLRSVIAGAIWTQERLEKASLVDSNACPYCNSGEVENQLHMWWRCPAWDSIRERHVMAQQAY
eukprot:318029-Karenia_brevis.AAC.1